jgi:RNA polymerase sigma-70 factor (ECF subfamily)
MKRATLAMPVDKPPATFQQIESTEAADSRLSAGFESIFLEYWPRIYAVLLRLVGDHAEAEDLALEAFMKVYRTFLNQDTRFNTGGWLYRVATHLGLNAIRSRKRRQRYEQESGRMEWLAQAENRPAELFAAEEQRQLVRKVLAEMSPRQAQLLTLRYSGQSYKEIAAAMNLAPASIGPLLARAEMEFEKRFRTAERGGV